MLLSPFGSGGPVVFPCRTGPEHRSTVDFHSRPAESEIHKVLPQLDPSSKDSDRHGEALCFKLAGGPRPMSLLEYKHGGRPRALSDRSFLIGFHVLARRFLGLVPVALSFPTGTTLFGVAPLSPSFFLLVICGLHRRHVVACYSPIHFSIRDHASRARCLH